MDTIGRQLSQAETCSCIPKSLTIASGKPSQMAGVEPWLAPVSVVLMLYNAPLTARPTMYHSAIRDNTILTAMDNHSASSLFPCVRVSCRQSASTAVDTRRLTVHCSDGAKQKAKLHYLKIGESREASTLLRAAV